MAQKLLLIPSLGEITIRKRKGARNMRLTISHDGQVKISIPSWSPYQAGEAFALSKKDWIEKQLVGKTQRIFEEGDRIGKGHRVRFITETRLVTTARVGKSDIVVRLPHSLSTNDAKVQDIVKKAALRALKQEATILLPNRVMTLAKINHFTFNSVSVKHLKTRWGSCSSQKDIALNCYLVQLPWDLIDYVIMHELVHTKIMAHGKIFWDELGLYVSDLAAKRKAIRSHHPALIPSI